MKRNLLAIATIISVLFSAPALADVRPNDDMLMSATTINGTGTAQTGVFSLDKIATDGNFTFHLNATSASGTADVEVELWIWNDASGTWQNTYYNTAFEAAATFKVTSSLTDFGGEGAFIVSPVYIPLVSSYKFIVTGVNSNPADTVVSISVTRK